MIVDKIEIKGKRAIIICDEKEYNINIDTYLSMAFDVGGSIDIDSVLFESDKRDALSKAIGYASRKMLTVRQLGDKLRKLEYSDEVIEYCVEKLKEYNYLNDDNYAQNYADSVKQTKGRMYIYRKLREKGISSEVIGKLDIEESIDSMLDILYKKYGKQRSVSFKDKAKMIRFLCTRGFLTSNAVKAVDLYIDNNLY